MRSTIAVLASLAALAAPSHAIGQPVAQHHPAAHGHCRTHACWQRVHRARVDRFIQRKIDAITPFGPCYGGRWAVPCGIIGHESKGRWWVLNTWTSGTPCMRRACGPYQFRGWRVPWPVRTLRDKLRHHREARVLWHQQTAGAAHHW